MSLVKLLALGAPGLYWPHDDSEPDPEDELNAVVQRLAILNEMPDAIRLKRVSEMTSSGSLLWDAMDFNPYGG
jgi:hypothetical protein